MTVALIMAQTVDGKIAQTKNQSSFDWTSIEDKKIFTKTNKKYKAIIIGNNTFKTFKKPLKNRLNIVYTKNPDSKNNIQNKIEYTNLAPKKLIKNLHKRGFKNILVAGGSKINSLFLNNYCIDEIYLTIEPFLFGRGISLAENINNIITLKLIKINKINQNTLLIKYRIKKNQ
jgi:dihydrofolate reductase